MSSWFNPKTEKRVSTIQGRGLFTREAIKKGEVIAVKGGVILDEAAFRQVEKQLSPAEIQIEDHLYIVPAGAKEVEANLLCLNHSCRPNVGVRGQITFVAMKDIQADRELTIDYAMIDGNSNESMVCSCGASNCRSLITGDDWRRPELQQRYSGFFSSYLNERIRANEQ